MYLGGTLIGGRMRRSLLHKQLHFARRSIAATPTAESVERLGRLFARLLGGYRRDGRKRRPERTLILDLDEGISACRKHNANADSQRNVRARG